MFVIPDTSNNGYKYNFIMNIIFSTANTENVIFNNKSHKQVKIARKYRNYVIMICL